MRGWKLRKTIVQGFNRVSEARLSAFKGGGLESSNTLSVWGFELLSKHAIVRMRGPATGGHTGGETDQQRRFIANNSSLMTGFKKKKFKKCGVRL